MNDDQNKLIERVLIEDQHNSREFFDSLSQHERDFVIQILQEVRDNGVSASLETLWEMDYESRPVPVLDFFEDEYFLGKILGKRLFPGWKPHIHNIMAGNHLEVCITGGIGLGKTQVTTGLMMYDLYKLLCLRDPHAFYGMPKNKKIAFAVFNISLKLVEGVGASIFTENLGISPYFKDITTRDPKAKNKYIFPKDIDVIIGSRFQHGLGYDVFSAFLDEANFGTDVNMDKEKEKKSQVLESYNALLARMESRFQEGGKIPGHMYLVSSKKSEADFLEKHIEERVNDNLTYVVDLPLYKIKTHKYDEVSDTLIDLYPSKKFFKVMIGDQLRDSQIVTDESEVPDGYRVIEVPEEHRRRFENDINIAIRDIAGISVYTESNFVLDRDAVRSCIDGDMLFPFTTTVPHISFKGSDTLLPFIKEKYFTSYLRSRPGRRAIGIDIGLTGDRLGIAMGYIAGKREVQRMNDIDLKLETVKEDVIVIDFMLRISYMPNEEIPLFKIVRFIMDLRIKYGVPVAAVSADGYQSAYLLQLFKTQAIEADKLSMDKDSQPYTSLKNAHYENRIKMYEYEPYLEELFALLYRSREDKVDHPDKGSKDISDAVAQVVWNLSNNKIFEDEHSRVSSEDVSRIMDEVQRMTIADVNRPKTLEDYMGGDEKKTREDYFDEGDYY